MALMTPSVYFLTYSRSFAPTELLSGEEETENWHAAKSYKSRAMSVEATESLMSALHPFLMTQGELT